MAGGIVATGHILFGEQQMDTIPEFLFITRADAERRAAAWDEFMRNHPPQTFIPSSRPIVEDATSRRMREELEKLKPVKQRRVAKPKPEPKRAPRDGLTPVGDVAAEFKIDARVARGYLRASSIKKPACGWAFTDGELKAVRDVIHAGIANEKTKTKKPTVVSNKKRVTKKRKARK